MISVVIPIYQVENYIESCIVSVCSQSNKDIEIILVNDGTEDNSLSIAKKTLSSYQVDYTIIEKENGGLSSARNVGLLAAKGEYVVFIDSDDTIQKDYIDVLLNGIISMNADMSIGMWQMVRSEHDRINDHYRKQAEYDLYKKNALIEAFLYRDIKPAPVCVLYRKSFLINNQLFFDENVLFSEDQEFFWRAFCASNGAVFTDRIIYNYFVRSNTITTAPQIDKILSGYKAIINTSKTVCLNGQFISDQIIGRWVLGVLHNTAHYCSFRFYKELYKSLEARSNCKSLLRFSRLSVRITALLCLLSRSLSYFIFRFLF